MMKLKLNTQTDGAANLANTEPVQTPGGSLKLSFKKPTATPPAASPTTANGTSAKKKPGPAKKNAGATTTATPAKGKKRAREDETNGAEDSASKKQRKGSILRLKSSQMQVPTLNNPKLLKLKTGTPTQQSPSTPTGPTRLKIKAKGKPPPRPLGVGYDSECEEAEEDPAMEEQFVLRMTPGPDCDYLRTAIEERKIGLPVSQGGADVTMRFFSRDGRRAMLQIRGRRYAAVLVDLPCIVESMKSWDKKGWWKSTDISQMLLVLGQVDTEEQAKDFALPNDLDKKTWQWPHGLTPPMHNVRRRRFRKRVSYRTIEAAEEEVERLLAADEEAKSGRGMVQWEILDLDRMRSEDAQTDESAFEDDADAYGEPDSYIQEGDLYMSNAGDEEEESDEAAAARLMAELEADDDDDPTNDQQQAGSSTEPSTALPATLMATASDSSTLLQHEVLVSADTPLAVQTPTSESGGAELVVESSANEKEDEDDEDDDDDDDEDDDEDEDDVDDEEEDEDAKERAQFQQQQREEIAHLQKELADARGKLSSTTNPLIRQRLQQRIKVFEDDLAVKKRGFGGRDDDDDDA